MADSKISSLTELTSIATGDLIPVVDVSDTTQGAGGTTKKITSDNLIPDASTTVEGKVELATDAETVTGTDTARATTPANITAKMAAPGAIGATTASTGKFTSVETTGNVELGHASDTTISRSSAGVIAVEGVVIPSISSTNTLTNKSIDGDDNTITNLGTGAIKNDAITPAKLLLGQDSNTVATEQTTTSTSYADLGTVGPTISYSPSATTTVLLLFGCYNANSAVGNTNFITPTISGATTLAAADGNAIKFRPSGTNGQEVVNITGMMLTTVSSGANTIKLQYRVDAGTGTFGNRFLIMIPLA